MTSIDESTWEKLTRPSGDRLVARIALPEISSRLLCALDVKGNRHLLILLHQDDAEYRDMQSRGVGVVTRNLVVQGQSPENYLDIECLDASGHPLFDLMGGEIARGLADEGKKPEEIVSRVLAKWRRFWGQLPQQLLTREEQLGLFAELLFLSAWLLPKMGPDATMAWCGPWGSRHDFEWSDKSVEVKATTNSRGHIHKINGISQLENPAIGPLYLFSVCLREEAGAQNYLPELIENCRSQILQSEEALTRFESALVRLGYSPIYQDEYAKLTLRVVDALVFIVEGNFPKLTTANFPSGLPSGIEQIEYEINLNTFSDLVVAHKPEELAIG